MLPVEYQPYLRKARIYLRLLDTWGALNAVAETAYHVNVSLYKSGGFTTGKIIGKLIKIVV